MSRRPEGPTPGSSADQVPAADPESFARNILLRQLTQSAKTRSQLGAALAKRGVPEDIAERLLQRFTDVGLIDDWAYARNLIDAQAAAGGLSRRGVAEKLRRRGVPKEIIDEVTNEIESEDEWSAAVDLARRKATRMLNLEPSVRRRRLAGVLARRGYPPDTVMSALREVEDELVVSELP